MDPDSFQIVQGISLELTAFIGIVGVVFGAGIIWGALRHKVNKMETELDEIVSNPEKYVLGIHCRDIRRQVAAQFCGKIDEVKLQLREMNEQREKARVEFAMLVGRLETFLNHAED